MLEILADISEGRGKEGDLDLLLDIAEALRVGSFCAMGQRAPTIVISALRHFRREFEEHILKKRCPAGACPVSQK